MAHNWSNEKRCYQRGGNLVIDNSLFLLPRYNIFQWHSFQSLLRLQVIFVINKPENDKNHIDWPLSIGFKLLNYGYIYS